MYNNANLTTLIYIFSFNFSEFISMTLQKERLNRTQRNKLGLKYNKEEISGCKINKKRRSKFTFIGPLLELLEISGALNQIQYRNS
jgi:hypothetical protein